MAYVHETQVGRFTVHDGGIVPTHTTRDGTPALTADEWSMLERRAARTVLLEVEKVNGVELRFCRKALGLRQVDLAEHLGVASETVSRWETGAEGFGRPVQLAVLALLLAADGQCVPGGFPRPLHRADCEGADLQAVA